jgi:hypothetical protein
MRELSNVGYGARTDMLLMPFERRWYDRTISACRRWERRLERSTVRLLKRIVDDGLGNAEAHWHEQASRRVELHAANDVEPIDDTPETTQAEVRAVEGIRRALPTAASRNEMAKAQLVLFTDPGAFALLPPAGHVIVLPEGDGRSIENSDERGLLMSVGALKPGMLTALPIETDRDLIDAWADRILSDGGTTRARADRWKDALKRHFAATGESYARFAKRMKEAGERRDALTIRSWANDTRSVAPRSYRRVLPLIANLTDDAILQESLDDTTAAIDGIYRVRTEAADAIVREVFSGAIDISQPSIAFEVDGRRVAYALARIERLVGIQDVPSELVGRQLHLADMTIQSGTTA